VCGAGAGKEGSDDPRDGSDASAGAAGGASASLWGWLLGRAGDRDAPDDDLTTTTTATTTATATATNNTSSNASGHGGGSSPGLPNPSALDWSYILRPHLHANTCPLPHRARGEFRAFFTAFAQATGRDPSQLPSRRSVVRLGGRGRDGAAQGSNGALDERDAAVDELLGISLAACRPAEVLFRTSQVRWPYLGPIQALSRPLSILI